MLQVLGLSEDAELVYEGLLADPLLGVAELRSNLGMPEDRVRAGLDELVRFALVRESRDSPGRLRAVNPEVGLTSLLHHQERELARRQQELAAQRSAVTDAVSTYASLRHGPDDGASQQLLSLDAIQARLEELAHELRHECLSVMPGGAQSQESLDHSRPLDHDALDRGISILTLYQDSVRNDPATYTYARWMTEQGGQVRTAPVLPPRMLIFDRRVAVIPLDPENTRLGALCTTEPAMVASLIAVYEHTWDMAVPLGASQDNETGLTPLDRELLRLLGGGLTDEAAGHRLGVSARTVRRQMASLMERLNATSRFEAGLKAAQRGWL
ncbi:LuxR C-terminal-related transcriptional regulator [Streptomyces sp. NPDC007851]|uniref:LuxR C-terminal-related transcriptional regulator n=1 Tax=Streptomyces sp. NPDC007851 TaxID=3155008 RepID=UPI0033FC4323